MIAVIALVLVLAVLVSLAVFTRVMARRIERDFPPLGGHVDVGGFTLHAVHVARPTNADLPPLVFIHGASGNLRDQMHIFRPRFEGRAEMLFVDRPGHGHSERGGRENDRPDGQARAMARAMRAHGIERAIIVGHSFGGAVAASFALEHPEMTAGLVFLAPASHPWPGGISWYNHIARRPLLGRVFTNTLSLPAGLARIEAGMACVFAPNPKPDDYGQVTGPALVLRPRSFRHNAADIATLEDYVVKTAPRYRAITAPTVIVTGDRDGVVLPDLHSRGLHRDIEGSELVWVRNLGHKPDYVATDLAVAAIERVAGRAVDLQAIARTVEARIADDDICGF